MTEGDLGGKAPRYSYLLYGSCAVLDPTMLLIVICRIAIAYIMGQITRNSSGDEIANVNFLYDDIVHVLQNTIDSCIPPQIDAAVMCGKHVYQIQ